MTDEQASDCNNVSFNVNHVPKCKDVVFAEPIPRGATRSIPITVKDKDNDPLTLRIVSPPGKGRVISIGTKCCGIHGSEEAESGPDSFKFVVADPQNQSDECASPCTVQVTIEKDNAPPVALSKSIVVQKNSSGNIVLLEATDDPKDKLKFEFPNKSDKGGGVVGIQQTGPHSMVVDYSPLRDFTGKDGFQFVANDGTDRVQSRCDRHQGK